MFWVGVLWGAKKNGSEVSGVEIDVGGKWVRGGDEAD